MKKIFTLFAAALLTGSLFAGTVTLTNANIVDAGTGASGYQAWSSITDEAGNIWSAYAIKNKHSNATSDKHFLQIKKYDTSTAYYIQIPELEEPILSIKMTVSGASKAMDAGSNTATVFFSEDNTTSAVGEGVASGTGDSEITIDASALALKSGYITAGGAVRIWEVEVTTGAATSPVLTVASTIDLGNVSYDEDFYEADTVVTVVAKNLTEDIAVSTESSKLSLSVDKIAKEGGKVTVSIKAEEGELNEEVIFKSGELQKTLTITGKIIKVVTLPGTPATMTTGTSAQDVTVNGVAGVKAGTGSAGGSLKVTVPANAAKLYFFAAAWKDEDGDIAIAAPEGVTLSANSVTVKSDAGISGSGSAYTLQTLTPSECTFAIDLSGVTEETEITFSREEGKKRFVVWGAAYETGGIADAISNTAVEGKAVKAIVNGQLLITRDGKTYNTLGAQIR